VVVARQAVDVTAELRAKVAAIHVAVGDRISAGDPIATLDDESIRGEIKVAKARLNAARADLSRASAEANEARQRYERRQEFEDVVPAEEVESAGFSTKKARATQSRASADVAHEKALIAQLELKLEDARITAPFSGKVAVRYVDPGTTVEFGQPILRVIDDGGLSIKFAVPASDVGALAVGQILDVSLEGILRSVPATIRHVSPELEPSTRMFFAEGELAIPADLIDDIHAGQVGRARPRK
jgi:RND family efflux transporter MFP subunit